MGGKMNVTVVVVAALVVVVVVASTSVLTAEASRLDLTSILGSIGIYQTDSLEVFDQENTYEKKKKGCCDMCLCTRSIPPQCQCTDIKASCHAQCKACRCTRSIPPQCRCMDINDFCYKKCPSSSTPSDEAAIGITN